MDIAKNDSLIPYKKGKIRSIVRFVRVLVVRLKNHKKIMIGSNVIIGKSADLTLPEFGRIGDRVSIGGRFMCQTNMDIGSDCLISSNVSFVGHDHDIEKSDSKFYSGRAAPSEVRLEGNNFIGFGSTVLGNVVIGYGSVVGACSLVTRDVPPGVVVVGIPAKVIRMLND